MEPAERVLTSPQLLADDNVSQAVGQTSTELLEAQSHHSTSQEKKHLFTEFQQSRGQSVLLEFQDSNLSPALSLLPGGEHVTEYSLFQQSDTEFAPLRAYPDVSVASERFHFSTQDHTSHVSECNSLSQHPLAHETILSEEGASMCSLSEHSLSPGDQRKQSMIGTTDERREVLSVEDAHSREEEMMAQTKHSYKIVGDAVEEEIYFLRKDVSAQHLLDLLQKEVSVPSSTSSAVSSASETSVKSTVTFTEEAKTNKCCKLAADQSLVRREGPPGEASLPQQQTQQLDQSSEVSNITMGSRSTQPDESSELLHKELLSEVQKSSKLRKSPTPLGQVFTPCLKEMPEGKQSHVPRTGPFSAGVERLHREQDLWSSGNQTGMDGSYLGFLPQSQSTPGVFKAPSKSSVKAKIGNLAAIESNEENSYQSSTEVSPQLAPSVAEDHHSNTKNQSQEDPTSAKVQSLPSLNYMQKVDAWRANQSSGKTSLFDNLALQGFSGISPKKKAYDAVSDTLNRILTQQARSLQQPLVSGAANKNLTQISSSTPPGSSSPRRGEAVGSAPSDKDNTGSAAAPSPSPFGRSQSHSSLSTVVMSLHKDQQTDKPAEKRNSQDDADNTVQPSPLMSLGQFSDVSLDQDLRLSSSQDSYKDIKLGASVGASSGVSLELDHYAPYWTSKLSTPPPLPKPRELNIDERIPLYLHNLGIDQSPSTILTPFAPRGPIREPEFSPTDICTIKGSTPTKSTQPSEGGSPQKGECSQSSILSVDSSMSMSVSLDSLGPAVSIPERARPTSPPLNAEELHRERRLAPSSLTDEGSPSSVLKQLDSSVASTQNITRSGEDSFVSSRALLEIRKLLSQAENVISKGSSSASSSSPTASRLLSDADIFLSLRSSRLQESSISSSSNVEDSQSRPSMFWARSSSDSVLTSDKQRQSSVAHDTLETVQDSTVSSGAGASLVLSNSARRTEPEGCSAAPPDKVPTNAPLLNPPPAVGTQQRTSAPTDTAGVPEEEKNAAHESSVQSSSSSPITEEADQGGISDVSSESSLAIRVAKLLQNESPATMVSSTPSVTDQEESKAREWIKLKVSGQQCEPLELDKEDRERIEEIKRELLLKNPIKSQGSTDTESSATSSVRVQWGPIPPQVSSDANIQQAQPQRGLSMKLPDSNTQLQNAPHTDLEARVNEIAAKEGVILPAQKPRPLISITIATCRRSTSPSPSTSPAPPLSPTPEPLHLAELCTGPVRPPTANRQPPLSLDEREKVVLAQTTKPLSTSSQKRQDTVGAQLEKPLSSLQGLDQEDVTVMSKSTNALKRDSAVGHGADQATGSSTAESSARTGHVSHVHLTLSPKATDHPVTMSVHSSHADALSGQSRKEFVPLRHFSSAASSPDEGVGLSSPPEWCDTREPVRQRAPERSDTSAMFKAPRPKGRTTTVSTPHPRSEVSPVSFNTETPVPVLLPYKPHGSEELFYVPQTEADVSSIEPSDTTMESSHTGSDDAVPPRFSSEVLGHQNSGLDRGITIRHVEGIYSKRLKTATFKMQEPGRRELSATLDQSSQTVTQTPKMSSQVSTSTREPLSSNQEAFRREQGTNPVYLHHHDQPELDIQTSVSQTERGRQSSGSLDQLWQRFCDQWTTEELRPISDRETSLLERLERLSRLIHSTRAADVSEGQEDLDDNRDHRRRREDGPLRRKEKKDFGEAMRSVGGEVRKPEPLTHQRLLVEGSTQPAEGDRRTSFSSGFSHSSSHSLHFSPAERDESETLSTMSDSMSTVDTARLVRVFGAHRVHHLKTSSSLSKLYSTINKQREGREQRRGRNGESPDTITPSETTDDSVAADSVSSASTYSLPARTLAAKKAVKLVNKGVQAGDLEIVSNGTRRRTRDVGTTFPSPGEDRAFEQISSSSPSRARRERNVSKTQGSQKQRTNKRSPSKAYPEGISWFISAEDMRSEARKENQPQETWRPSAAWFEPYSKVSPWREPLRQRQVHEDRNRPSSITRHAEPDPDPRSKQVSSGLARISLQEALEMRRPEFISRSQERVKCLTLQAEERKLQAVFNRERDELFNQPAGPAVRLPKPAGTALLRRAVPRKEMIQRSKQIYESLPEVQRRREEERRRAEYRSYRLNAQLYNKRITNRVLGRRSAWH